MENNEIRGLLRPPCNNIKDVNSLEKDKTSKEKAEVIIEDYTKYENYEHPLIETLKRKGLMERFCNFVRTIRASKVCNAGSDDVKQISDADLCQKIEDSFSFGGLFKFSTGDLKKCLFVYPELLRAYMAGQVELKTVLQETIIRKLEKADSTENIELGIKYMDTLAKIEQSNIKKQNGVVFNISDVSNDTKSTIKTLMDSLSELDTSELEERGEDPEVLEYEQMEDGD